MGAKEETGRRIDLPAPKPAPNELDNFAIDDTVPYLYIWLIPTSITCPVEFADLNTVFLNYKASP